MNWSKKVEELIKHFPSTISPLFSAFWGKYYFLLLLSNAMVFFWCRSPTITTPASAKSLPNPRITLPCSQSLKIINPQENSHEILF